MLAFVSTAATPAAAVAAAAAPPPIRTTASQVAPAIALPAIALRSVSAVVSMPPPATGTLVSV